MGIVIADITMSLDGFVTGPDAGPGQGLGRDGMPLHDWAISDRQTDADREILRRATARTGAVIMGRNTFDVVDAPDGWSEEIAYGAAERPEALPPVFVLTHDPPAQVRLSELFRFATDGLQAAVAHAREAAGDRDVTVMGGGDVVRQVVEAGLADELIIHLSPILLGAGTPLWGDARIELVQRDVVVTGTATHITYDTLSNARGAET
jgi:dihydrofolate reductase